MGSHETEQGPERLPDPLPVKNRFVRKKVLSCFAWLLLPIGLVGIWLAFDWWVAIPEGRRAEYVGRQSCVECHAEEDRKWKNSDHDLAMDLATPEFVLGDFNNTQLEHYGVVSRMFRRGDAFFVETEGPDGKRGEFRVKYVIGYRPLQQYMAELDGGRVQVLPVTWDTETKRWFCAVPDAPFGPEDPLHWTGSAQNWNHMCADCHTTNFAKNFDVKTATYHYSFSEIDVSCEMCHGPGSLHVEMAKSKSVFWDRRIGYGLARLTGEDPQPQLETCAPCHARRRQVYPHFQAGDRFYDYYDLSLLEAPLYFPDGQILDEVYVYGSFNQSLMHRKAVRCTNCHDPHTTRVKFQDNRLCTQCHMAAKYDTPVHHHHKSGTVEALCVECHMPARNYMVVDPRRDHSLRRPRPDLTVAIGVPNACNNCHRKDEETAQWATDKIVEWYGPKREPDPHYGEILAAGRKGERGILPQLIRLARTRDVGPIVRATAVSLMATHYQTRASFEAVVHALHDAEPLVRAAALRAFEGQRPSSYAEANELSQQLAPLLTDPVRLVRIEAARALVGLPSGVFSQRQSVALNKALDEYKAGLFNDADQSGSHVALGILYTDIGRVDAALEEYRTAIRLEPAVVGPRTNLAQLYEQLGKKTEAQQLREEEEKLLARDARLLPNNASLHYRLGLLRYLLGRQEAAVESLSKACDLEPETPDFLMALTLLYEKQQRWQLAIHSAEKLTRLQPDNAMFDRILKKIRQEAAQKRMTSDENSR